MANIIFSFNRFLMISPAGQSLASQPGKFQSYQKLRSLCGHLRSTSSTPNRRMSSFSEANPGDIVVEKSEVHRYMVDCFQSVDVDPIHAEQMAEVLMAADMRGHYSHGLNRLDMYINDVKHGICEKTGTPSVLQERAATAWVDGNNLLGAVVGNFCMKLAIKKAMEAGVGWVTARGSNHFGIAGHYSMMACKEGMIGMSFTNTSPIMVPTRAKRPAIGTNPISVAAPGSLHDSYVLDMATTGVAVGKVELTQRKGEQLPHGWAVNAEGVEETDPTKVTKGRGGLYPLGGSELTGGYKGYGMGVLVELFCGILAGASWGTHVRTWMATDKEANLGQCFVAIDPSGFAPGFKVRLQEFMDTLRQSPTVEGETEKVLVAGDPERLHMAMIETMGGIPYHPSQIAHAKELADELNITTLRPKGSD